MILLHHGHDSYTTDMTWYMTWGGEAQREAAKNKMQYMKCLSINKR
jgi:hypothetical protein